MVHGTPEIWYGLLQICFEAWLRYDWVRPLNVFDAVSLLLQDMWEFRDFLQWSKSSHADDFSPTGRQVGDVSWAWRSFSFLYTCRAARHCDSAAAVVGEWHVSGDLWLDLAWTRASSPDQDGNEIHLRCLEREGYGDQKTLRSALGFWIWRATSQEIPLDTWFEACGWGQNNGKTTGNGGSTSCQNGKTWRNHGRSNSIRWKKQNWTRAETAELRRFMEEVALLCEMEKNSNTFLVPCLLPRGSRGADRSSTAPQRFVLDFKASFLPDSLFRRLICYAVQKSSRKDRLRLFASHAFMSFEGHDCVLIWWLNMINMFYDFCSSILKKNPDMSKTWMVICSPVHCFGWHKPRLHSRQLGIRFDSSGFVLHSSDRSLAGAPYRYQPGGAFALGFHEGDPLRGLALPSAKPTATREERGCGECSWETFLKRLKVLNCSCWINMMLT